MNTYITYTHFCCKHSRVFHKIIRNNFVHNLHRILVLLSLSFVVWHPDALSQPCQEYAYIPNVGSNNVSVIAVPSNNVVATIPVGDSPVSVCHTSTGSHVYISNYDSDNVSVIETASQSVVATVPLTPGAEPLGVGITPDNQKVFVANNGNGTVTVIETATNTVLEVIDVCPEPFAVQIAPDGSLAYVTNFYPNQLITIDVASLEVLDTMSLTSSVHYLEELKFSPDGSLAFIMKSGYEILFFNTATQEVVDSIVLPSFVITTSLVVSADGQTLYVGYGDDSGTGGVIKADIPSSSFVGYVKQYFMTIIGGIGLSSDGSLLYVTRIFEDLVDVIQTSDHAVVATLVVGDGPDGRGDFMVECSTPSGGPINDLCANAILIQCPDIVSGTNVGATSDAVSFCGTTPGESGVWYKIIGTGDEITLTTCNGSTNFDTQIHVYSGPCGDLECVVGSDDDLSCAFSTLQTTVTFLSSLGVEYSILISGFQSEVGGFTLQSSCGNEMNRSLHFDGINDNVYGVSNPLFELVDGTIELWVRPELKSTKQTMICYRNESGSSTRFLFNFLENLSGLGFWNGTAYATFQYAFDPEVWYHLAFVDDGVNTKIYINGEHEGTFLIQFNTATGSDLHLVLGYDIPLTEYFKGQMDEVRIWSSPLSQATIAANMSCGISGTEECLVAYYTFNQGTPSGSNGTVNTLFDASINNLDAVLRNFALAGSSSNWLTATNGVAGSCSGETCPSNVIIDLSILHDCLVAGQDTLHYYPTWREHLGLLGITINGTITLDPAIANWTSSNDNVATVSNGHLVAVGPGTATITAELNGETGEAFIRVIAPVLAPVYNPLPPSLTMFHNECAVKDMPVIIIRYLPTTDGVNLDVAYAPDFFNLGAITLADMEQRLWDLDDRVRFALEEGTRYRDYGQDITIPYLGYRVVEMITVYEPTPRGPLGNYDVNGLPIFGIDYHSIFERFNLQHYVNNLGVKEIWLWQHNIESGYPSYDPDIHLPCNSRYAWESNMSSPITGDISNSNQDPDDLPILDKTYILYGQNIRRSQAEAVHNHGHQLERMIPHINFLQDGNTDLFWKDFVGQDDIQNFITGRCGWTHMPPNTTTHYEYLNPTLVWSDIMDWSPAGGAQTLVNVDTWGDIPYDWPGAATFSQKTESQWYLFWMQSFPGNNNSIQHGPDYLTNWWDIIADWDLAIASNMGVYANLPAPDLPCMFPRCGSVFSDSGGPNGNYANNEDMVTVLCPESQEEKIQLTFSSFMLETDYDFLKIFDGNSITAPPLHTGNGFTGNSLPGPFISTHASGCLTAHFTSDISVTQDGWQANIECLSDCATLFADSGGTTSNYENDEDITTTFCPGGDDEIMEVTFTSFHVESAYDALYILDGPLNTDPQFFSGNPATLSGFPAGGYYGTNLPGTFVSSHPSGCLTFRFRSDGSLTYPGWTAVVVCGSRPVNDHCDDALLISCNTVISGSNRYATSDGSPICDYPPGFKGVWYKMIGTGDPIRISTCTADFTFDTQLFVYTGTCGDLDCIAGNDDDFECPDNGLKSTVTFPSVLNEEYLILLTGYQEAAGDFTMSVECLSPCTSHVTNLNDQGPGSLRDAIECAAAGETITFDPSINNQVIQLTSGTIFINRNITMAPSINQMIMIKGSDNQALFNIYSDNTIHFENIHFYEGQNLQESAFINDGDLFLKNITIFRDNTGQMALIQNLGILTIDGLVEIKATPAGSISSLNCASATHNGTLTEGIAASGVSSNVPYTGGNGGTHNGQTVTSTGVTGLTATLVAGSFATGAGSLTYTITGTPGGSGTASFALNIGGQSCTLTRTVDGTSQYPAGSVFCASGASAIVDVTNPSTGKIWMDRNLGATQVATSSTDANSYGDLYQWGRGSDGHQCRTSPTTTTLSSTDQPGHGNFIITDISPDDWRSPQNANLWQGVNGVNNPCPSGYRLPTEAELNAERLSWISNNSAGAFASPLKLPLAGLRLFGSVTNDGEGGNYWSSTVNSTLSRRLVFTSSDANAQETDYIRGSGFSVRCISDANPAGSISSLNCASATHNGTLTAGIAASGVSSNVPYTGGNGGTHNGQTVTSTGVTGLTATLVAGSFANGAGSLTYTITGTPGGSGTASFALNIGGQSCTLTRTVDGTSQYPAGSVFCASGASAIVDVTNPSTGRIWMDRNLGATQVATSSTDANSYGDLYQWGRRSDGHQCRTSPTTTTLSSTDQPGHGNFILPPSPPFDWRSPQNANLWQGVNGVNNPCPSGYRLPTDAELDAERLSWSSNNSAGAFASPLKLPVAGGRDLSDGLLYNVGSTGNYWSSSISSTGSGSDYLLFTSGSSASPGGSLRANGLSVRCTKN